MLTRQGSRTLNASPVSQGTPRATATPPPATVTPTIDIKNIKSTVFIGAVPEGSYDSGAREWWEQFADQADDAQVLAGQLWNDKVNTATLSLFLSGSARRWLKQHRHDHPRATFAETGDALVAKFRPKLTDQEITARIYDEPKLPAETYQEFADRLLLMVGGLDGGSTNPANARHALGTFVRHAWPQRKDVVMARISLRDADPLRAIARAVDILSEMSETDGRAPSFKKRKMDDGKT
ncbi:hypothetical protein PF004_g31489, partial [Phytophthora fragariae]